MAKFTTVNLSKYFNSPARLKPGGGREKPRWHRSVEKLSPRMPRGKQTSWGIPFVLGPLDARRKGLVVIVAGQEEVEIKLRGEATHLCILHFCNLPRNPEKNAAGGEHLADYCLRYQDGTEAAKPIHRRFEVSPFSAGWGRGAFAAVNMNMPGVATPENMSGWGRLQTGVAVKSSGFRAWLYALENPHPGKRLAALLLRSRSKEPVGILGLTLYQGSGHPLRHLPRSLYRLMLPRDERADSVEADIDMGSITRTFAVPYKVDDKWLKSEERGLGKPRSKPRAQRDFLIEATGAEGATLTVTTPTRKRHEFLLGEVFTKGKATSQDGSARIEMLHPRKTWVHVTVSDAATGKPTPTRIHFSGTHGEYIAPYGHHTVVNDNWFEDYGGDLQLGDTSFAYVPGRFQIELPVGEVYVELSKGFEYRPLRKRLSIRAGQRELTIKVGRSINLRQEGWVTADTHVHFISPQTAWLEGQAEGLNLINLLASQWGRLYTNVADITGELSGCSRDDTLVWVGTENRHHLLGHMSLLGTHGDPVFPMCAGGPGEAYLGDPDVTTITEWARACKERQGVTIRPHFPSPICEEPVYFIMGELDGAELRQFADPARGSLEEFVFSEWYRYLNCGYRVAAVGGTDKMSAGMPVGGVRTYAKLAPDEPFTFENWGKAIRAGRSFTTSGPLLDLTVEGRTIGDEIRLSRRGGRLEVRARAECIWPIHMLELVVNGKVVASTSRKQGAKVLELNEKVEVKRSSWIAARAGSRLKVEHCWPIHLGAHTSPVYIVVGNQDIFSPSDASYMLTLIDGGLTFLDTLSVRYDEKRHQRLKAVFQQAQHKLLHRLDLHHGHG